MSNLIIQIFEIIKGSFLLYWLIYYLINILTMSNIHSDFIFLTENRHPIQYCRMEYVGAHSHKISLWYLRHHPFSFILSPIHSNFIWLTIIWSATTPGFSLFYQWTFYSFFLHTHEHCFRTQHNTVISMFCSVKNYFSLCWPFRGLKAFLGNSEIFMIKI